jgi:paraquat-inducible protein B
METNTYLAELASELAELKEELKVINKHLVDKKKMNNNYFKDLITEKDEVEKLITEVEIEIEIITKTTKELNDGNSDNLVN